MNLVEMPGWLRGSEMGELIFDHDWTESGLGPISTWPPNLKFAVNTILLMPSAALLLWGPRHIQIYNDNYRDLMGLKHPGGLGQPVSACWPEVWNFLAPICEGVMQRRESFIFDDEPLLVNRTGTPEEAFFRLTYSPIPDEIDSFPCGASNTAGAEASAPGIFVTVSETTEKVNERAGEADRARLREALQAKRIQLLEEVFRNSPSFLYVLRGPGLVFELANEAYYQLVGHRKLLGRPLFEALPEAVEDYCRRQLAKVMATGKPFIGWELPITVISDPGQPPEKRFIDAVYLPLLEEDGSYEYVLGHGVDVTDHVRKREKTEQALFETERRFRDALEIDTVGVIFLDKDGHITEANDAFLEMSGFSREDERAGLLRCNELTPPEWMATTLRAGEELKATGRATPYEKELFRKDGSRWWALIAAMQLNKKEGVVYIIDITERKRVEQNLRESEARFRAMAEASPALTWQVNARGDLVYVNQRVMDMVGMTLEELLPSRWRSVLHPDDEPGCLAAIEQALLNRSRFQYRVRARGRGGEWHWLESYALPWFTGPDEYAGHVGVSIDITEAVKAETALREADLRKDEFLATLAHELRNPLAPIANALAVIARPEGAAAVPHLLPVINRQVNYMIRLVDDLLEISRITSGKVELRQAPVDLAVVLHNAVEAGRPQIDGKEHKLSVSIYDAPLIVYADAVRLEQVFTNLLNNAARYTGQRGQIWLTAHWEADNAVVSIRDNGIGILAGMLPRLFDMFAQERRNGVGTQEGLGIGLSLVYRLVKMHGGTVEARSEGKDRGSEFIVRLPLAASVIQGEMMEPEKTAAAPTGLRILVVDDNHDAAEVLSMLLESMGLDVHSVDSGPAALAAIPEYRPNIILMDIGMPGMDGNEVARRIREQPQFNDIKLIALTGWGQEKDRRLSHESGFDYHLTKPVNFKVLKGLIDAF
ncbi:hybrid sensor histidine kinase/response regulator [Nitrosospira briensis]|uniref:hybrid sensor histidine kinase/response regulator n=1 Tax=Nitrosospira briensis TaxID=35799 RepID=UPI0008F42F0F|nr:PAS domain S-box protein [Nitrosospira briensis]SFN74698.1 PAS domain S-box-containing protein [Nitrosospira briensis]